MDNFSLKLTRFEITGLIGKTCISLRNLIINFYFEIRDRSSFSSPEHFFIVESAFLKKWKCTEIKKKTQVKPRKIKIEREQILMLFQKKKQKKSPRPIKEYSLLSLILPS